MKAKIKLAFRVVIDQNSKHVWDKYVFEDSYLEYKIQHQAYNDSSNPVKNYWELIAKNPNAEKIPFLLASAINGYIQQLKGKIHSLEDVLGTTFFEFENYKIDLVSSHLEDSSKHQLGITFYTPLMTLIDIVDRKYVLSFNTYNSNKGFETFMFPFHPQVAIAYYEKK